MLEQIGTNTIPGVGVIGENAQLRGVANEEEAPGGKTTRTPTERDSFSPC